MYKTLLALLALTWALPSQAAMLFDYQSNSTSTAKFAAGLGNMARVTSAAALTLTSGPAGTFGGTYLDMSSAPVISWQGQDNCPIGATNISVLMRIVPVGSGVPAARKTIISLNGGALDNNQGLRGGFEFDIDTAGKLSVTGGALGSTGLGYFNNSASSVAFTLVANTPTDIGFAWGGTSATTAKVYQDSVQIGTITANANMSAMDYAGCTAIQTYGPSNLTTNNLFHINEIAIFNTVENFAAAPYVGRTGFLTSTSYIGYSFSSPTANKVQAGTTYGPGPNSLTGTGVMAAAATTKIGTTANDGPGAYDGSDRWSCPAAGDLVDTAASLKCNSTSTNLTGTYLSLPTYSAQAGALYGPASAYRGTYDGSDRWTCPPAGALLTSAANLKCNSTSTNLVGTYDASGITTSTVKHGQAFGVGGASTGAYFGADYCTDPGRDNVRSTASYKVAGVDTTGNYFVASTFDVKSGQIYGVGGTGSTGRLVCTQLPTSVVSNGTAYTNYAGDFVGAFLPACTSVPPDVADVRSGKIFTVDSIGYVGTLAVPPVSKVQLGYAYDDGLTVGTSVCTALAPTSVASGLPYTNYAGAHVGTLGFVTNTLSSARLNATPIKLSQGDAITLALTATNGTGTAFDITGAVFETRIKGADGTDVVLDDAHHAITSTSGGTYTVDLSASETALLALGTGKEIVTKITQGGRNIYFHGYGLLSVQKSTPER